MISCRMQPSEDSDQLGHEKSPIADGVNFRTTVVIRARKSRSKVANHGSYAGG